ncbi:MAG: hypothetical protein ACREQQ_08195, partial [Candidatus Binatia bacterium]
MLDRINARSGPRLCDGSTPVPPRRYIRGMHEKDPFVDKLRDKERAEEDRYFAERDRALLEKLRLQDEESREATARALARERCPKCGSRLV